MKKSIIILALIPAILGPFLANAAETAAANPAAGANLGGAILSGATLSGLNKNSDIAKACAGAF